MHKPKTRSVTTAQPVQTRQRRLKARQIPSKARPAADTPSPPKKQKQVISTAAMFTRPPPVRTSATSAPKHVANLAGSAEGAQVGRKFPGPSILKKARIAGESIAAKHPIAVAFNETTSIYLTHTRASLAADVDQVHASLLAEFAAAVSTDPTASPSASQGPQSSSEPLTARYTTDIAILAAPLGGVTLTSAQWSRDVTLNERLSQFSKTLEAEVKAVNELQKEYDEVKQELFWVFTAVVGEAEARKLWEESGIAEVDGEGRVVESTLEALDIVPAVQDEELKAMETTIEGLGEVALQTFWKEESERAKAWKKQDRKVANTLKELWN